jgi:hypothetical protein
MSRNREYKNQLLQASGGENRSRLFGLEVLVGLAGRIMALNGDDATLFF